MSPWKNRSYQTPSYTPNTTCNRYVYGGAINFIQDFQFDSRDWLGEKTPFSTPPRPTADIQNFQPFTPGSWNALQAVVAQIQSVPILQSLDPLLLNPIFPLEANIIDQFKGIDSCPVDGCNYVFLPCNVTTTGGDIPVVKISCEILKHFKTHILPITFCPFCKKNNFRGAWYRDNHILSVHHHDFKHIHDTECGKTFSTKKNFDAHKCRK